MTRPALCGGWLVLLAAPVAAHSLPLPLPAPHDSHGQPLPAGAVARLGDPARRFSPVQRFSFSPDGRLVARSRVSGTDIREAATGRDLTPEFLRTLAGEVAFTPGRALFHSDNKSGTYRVLDAATGRVLIDVSAPGRYLTGAQFLPDGQGFAALVRDPDSDYHVRVFTPSEGPRPAGRRVTATGWYARFAFLPGGRWLVASIGGGLVNVHDAASGKRIFTHELRNLGSAAYPVLALPDGETVLVAQAGELVALRITPEGVEPGPVAPTPDPIDHLQLAPDGRTVFATSPHGAVWRYDWPAAKATRLLEPEPAASGRWPNPVLSPDGTVAAECGDKELGRVFSVEGGKDLIRYEGLVPVRAVWARPGGRVTVSDRAGVREYSVSGEELGVRPLPAAAAREGLLGVSADGRTGAFVVPGQPGRLVVRDLESGKELWRQAGESHDPIDARFSPDGSRLVVVRHGAARRGGVVDAVQTVEVLDAATGTVLFDAPVGLSTAVSPDGRLLAAGGKPPARVIELASGKTRLTFDPSAACVTGTGRSRLRFSRDGRVLAGFGGTAGAAVWSLDDGELLYSAGGEGQDNDLAVGDVSPDGRWLAHAHRFERRVRVWEWAAPRATSRDVVLAGHEGAITDVTFTPDGKHLLTASEDGTVLVWDAARFAERAKRPENGADPAELWAALGEPDAAEAGRAVAALVRRPTEAVALARRSLPPAAAPSAGLIAKLIAELGDERCEVRDKAEAELAGFADLAAPALREALNATTSSAERRHRAERLLNRLHGPVRDADRLRVVRAVEVVERAGTPESRELLATWAAGAEHALLTREARAALARVEGR